MTDPLAETTVVARLQTDAATAQRLTDLFSESFEPAEAAAGASEAPGNVWQVALHFRTPPNQTAVRALVALAADQAAANALVFETVGARDWVKASLEGLAPVPAGRFLVHGAHDRARVPRNALGIEIEAALAFGTGHHGTTRGCLLAIDSLLRRRRPRRVLDIGTGTGVLAIAAAKAARRPVLASDIDPVAVAVARANARGNGVGALVRFVVAPGVRAHALVRWAPFDLIVANILLGPLQRLAAPTAPLLARHGRLVLSGLLPAQANAVIAAFGAQGLALERRLLLDGWVTLVLRRGRARRCAEAGNAPSC
jgi:ribosomal protein L11 methyltransferase